MILFYFIFVYLLIFVLFTNPLNLGLLSRNYQPYFKWSTTFLRLCYKLIDFSIANSCLSYLPIILLTSFICEDIPITFYILFITPTSSLNLPTIKWIYQQLFEWPINISTMKLPTKIRLSTVPRVAYQRLYVFLIFAYFLLSYTFRLYCLPWN